MTMQNNLAKQRKFLTTGILCLKLSLQWNTINYYCPLGHLFDHNQQGILPIRCGNWTWEAPAVINQTTCQRKSNSLGGIVVGCVCAFVGGGRTKRGYQKGLRSVSGSLIYCNLEVGML